MGTEKEMRNRSKSEAKAKSKKQSKVSDEYRNKWIKESERKVQIPKSSLSTTHKNKYQTIVRIAHMQLNGNATRENGG